MGIDVYLESVYVYPFQERSDRWSVDSWVYRADSGHEDFGEHNAMSKPNLVADTHSLRGH